jgi:hypothetical protein
MYRVNNKYKIRSCYPFIVFSKTASREEKHPTSVVRKSTITIVLIVPDVLPAIPICFRCLFGQPSLSLVRTVFPRPFLIFQVKKFSFCRNIHLSQLMAEISPFVPCADPSPTPTLKMYLSTITTHDIYIFIWR